MTASPSLAVVVPVRDGARYLPTALASVAAQTLPAHEVVVVDDGSSDDSAALAVRAGARVLRQQNAGPGAARNRAVTATSCELVAFLDADDVFLPDKLERQVRMLQMAPDAIGVCSDAFVLGGARDGQVKNAGWQVPARLRLPDLLRRNPVIASSVVVRRAAIEHVGGFDEDPVLIATEDYDLWLRVLASSGAYFAYIDTPLVRYRAHTSGLSGSGRFLAGIDRIAAKLHAAHPDDPEVAKATQARQAEARLDAAWTCLQRGEREQARALVAQARALAGTSWKSTRLWLRSWL